MKQSLVTISGYIDNPQIAIDTLIATYYTTLQSQSTLHSDSIRSLIRDIDASTNDINLKENIEASMTYLLNPYFADNDVEVTVVDDNGRKSIKISVAVIDDGQHIDITKDLAVKDSRLVELSLSNVQGTT